MHILVASVKKASNVLVPALCLLYIYATVGLYSFSSTFAFIQTSNTTSAGTPTTGEGQPTGLSTRRRCSYVGKGHARW